MDLLPFESALSGRRILVTGNTGFTGAWISFWLQAIGAEIKGFSLRPDTTPALFESLWPDSSFTTFADVRARDELHDCMASFAPHAVLHLAAQPLVLRSYRETLRTFEVNTAGTLNVIESASESGGVKAVLCVTSDKVYRMREGFGPRREEHELGGVDPYSASKAAAEMIVEGYAASLLRNGLSAPRLATARAGNIIGGGDWAENRLLPDYVRAAFQGAPLTLRHPGAVRPWQHVLDVCFGYMSILAGLLSDDSERFARPWNLGPRGDRDYAVGDVIELLARHLPRPRPEVATDPLAETGALRIDSADAYRLLAWEPVWTLEKAVEETAKWYAAYYADPARALVTTRGQWLAWRDDFRSRPS